MPKGRYSSWKLSMYGPEIQVRQFPPLMLLQKGYLAPVEAKRGEDRRIAKLLFGKHAPIEPLQQPIEMRITQRRSD